MTDDEINRRVAEIEGWWIDAECGNYFHSDARYNQMHGGLIAPPPYATDWPWCGPLILKYRLSLYPQASEWRCTAQWATSAGGRAACGRDATTPQRAICLAVIDANRPQS